MTTDGPSKVALFAPMVEARAFALQMQLPSWTALLLPGICFKNNLTRRIPVQIFATVDAVCCDGIFPVEHAAQAEGMPMTPELKPISSIRVLTGIQSLLIESGACWLYCDDLAGYLIRPSCHTRNATSQHRVAFSGQSGKRPSIEPGTPPVATVSPLWIFHTT
ncbi:MAG: hypothetical protein H7839_00905 [Magnetococcus sp. YQC-5]